MGFHLVKSGMGNFIFNPHETECNSDTTFWQAYFAWMKGSLHFELENWKSAMELYNKARYVRNSLFYYERSTSK